MTSMERKACLALRGVEFGRAVRYRVWARGLVRLGDLPAWPRIMLTERQRYRLARSVRKFRRQIANPNLLFWSQRVLAELFQSQSQEEPCQQP
jgi:hypothetical protein